MRYLLTNMRKNLTWAEESGGLPEEVVLKQSAKG